jgi:chloride channel protein, CIC family
VLAAQAEHADVLVGELARPPLVAKPDDTLRAVADRMVAEKLGVLPVVEYGDRTRLLGLVSQFDLLQAHERLLVEERHRERPLTLRRLSGGLGGLLPTRESV